MNEDKVIQKLMEHDERFDRIEHKMEGLMTAEAGQKLMDIMDHLATAVKKIGDDQFFTVELYKRMQKEIDNQKEEIHKIKLQLKMA